MKRIKMIDIISGNIPEIGTPWICDWRSFDIPETITKTIECLPIECVAISLSLMGGYEMIEAASIAANKKRIRILWWFGPSKNDISVENQRNLRNFARSFRC